jgi:hypothetical protein
MKDVGRKVLAASRYEFYICETIGQPDGSVGGVQPVTAVDALKAPG